MQFLLLTGLLALLGQVVLLRELNVAFFGVELIYILAIGVWMCGTALGALFRARAAMPSGAVVRWLTLLGGLSLPTAVVFLRASRTLLGGVPGAFLSIPLQVLALLAVVLPVALVFGLLFQRAARGYVERGRSLAEAYAIECLGGLAAGVAATLFLHWGVQNFALAAGCAAVAAVGSIAPDDQRTSGATLTLRSAAALVLCLAIMALWRSGAADRAMTRWNHPGLVVTRDTPYGRVSVVHADGQLSVFENDSLSFETQGTTAEEFAHLVALQHPDPRRVLLLGGGLEGLAREILKHRPVRIDNVELDRALFDAVVPHLPGDIQEPLRAPAVHLTFTDPRRFLRTSSRYDLILVAMGEPAAGQANRFYTREFLSECARRLTATGVLGYRLQSAENVWTPLFAGRMRSLLGAPLMAFRDVVILPGATNIVLASRSTLTRDPVVLGDRLTARKIQARLVSPAFIRYLYTNDRRLGIERTLAEGGAIVNSDARPVCYQYGALLWLSKFFPSLSTVDPPALVAGLTPAGRASAWLIALLAPAALFAGARFSNAWRRTMMVAVAGFAGMVLETILLLHYQAMSGVLYQDIGLLLTSFMAGLAAGALIMAKLPAHLGSSRSAGSVILAAFALQSVLVAWQTAGSGAASLVAVGGMLACAGALVGALFAFASLRTNGDQVRAIGPLYAADLTGGAAGAVAGSLVLIPLAGLVTSSLLTALLAALALLLV